MNFNNFTLKILFDQSVFSNKIHRVIDHFESLLEFDLPFKNYNNNLNLDVQSSFKYRLYFISFLVTQFLCCFILFWLNNWHYLPSRFLNTSRSLFKRTESVADFIEKIEYESKKLSYFENFVQKKKDPEIIFTNETQKNTEEESRLRESSSILTIGAHSIVLDSVDNRSSYLYVPYFRHTKSNSNLSAVIT